MKICSKCHEEKHTNQFSRNARRADGLSNWCKSCTKTYNATRTRTTAAVVLLLLGLASGAGAQTRERVTTRAILGWDMENTLPAVANATLYRVYIDGAAVGQLLPGAVCTAANLGAQATPGSICQAPFPPLTPGDHTLTLTADLDSDESDRSAPPLGVTFVVRVTPTNTRIVRKLATALPK